MGAIKICPRRPFRIEATKILPSLSSLSISLSLCVRSFTFRVVRRYLVAISLPVAVGLLPPRPSCSPPFFPSGYAVATREVCRMQRPIMSASCLTQ